MNESLQNEINVNEIVDASTIEETPKSTGKPIIGVLLIGAGAIAAGALIAKAISKKKEPKPKKANPIEKWAKNLLIKKGYVVVESLDDLDDEDVEVKDGVEKN